MPQEQLGVKCLSQGHIGVSEWMQTWVSNTTGMCLIHCAITTPHIQTHLPHLLKIESNY